MKLTTLTRAELAALSWAVREVAAWRGSMTGNPDPAPLAEFDRTVKLAKTAMAKVRRGSKSINGVEA